MKDAKSFKLLIYAMIMENNEDFDPQKNKTLNIGAVITLQ